MLPRAALQSPLVILLVQVIPILVLRAPSNSVLPYQMYLERLKLLLRLGTVS